MYYWDYGTPLNETEEYRRMVEKSRYNTISPKPLEDFVFHDYPVELKNNYFYHGLFWSVIGVFGMIVSSSVEAILITGIPAIIFFTLFTIKKREYFIITTEGIKFFNSFWGKREMSWNEIEQIAFYYIPSSRYESSTYKMVVVDAQDSTKKYNFVLHSDLWLCTIEKKLQDYSSGRVKIESPR